MQINLGTYIEFKIQVGGSYYQEFNHLDKKFRKIPAVYPGNTAPLAERRYIPGYAVFFSEEKIPGICRGIYTEYRR